MTTARVTENDDRVTENDDRVMKESTAESGDDKAMENDESMMKEKVTENEDRITKETVIVNDHRVMNNDDEPVECSTDISQPVVIMQTSAIAVP